MNGRSVSLIWRSNFFSRCFEYFRSQVSWILFVNKKPAAKVCLAAGWFHSCFSIFSFVLRSKNIYAMFLTSFLFHSGLHILLQTTDSSVQFWIFSGSFIASLWPICTNLFLVSAIREESFSSSFSSVLLPPFYHTYTWTCVTDSCTFQCIVSYLETFCHSIFFLSRYFDSLILPL